MADAAVLMLLSRLALKMEKMVREEGRLALHPNAEAQKLSSKLKKIHQVLLDAEQTAITDPKVRSWLDKLQDISYDIDEVLDEWDLHNLKHQSASSRPLHKKVSSFLHSGFHRFKQSVVRHPVARNIRSLNERLDLVSQENENEFNFIPNLSREPQDFRRIISTSIVDVSKVHGREDDQKSLIKKLFPRSSSSVGEDGCHIVSIVGAGGMGKTTLAQLAFNDHTVKDHFKIKIWVCVSHPFDEIKIAKAILEAVDRNSPNLSQFEALLQSIKDSISGKRFLLVLDDVWSEDDTMWKPLHIALVENGAPGSRILVTTRKRKVAEIMGSTEVQVLDPLSDPYCWSILSQIAFHGRKEGDCKMLEKVGREIALKCKGMPLAAKTLGGLLRFKNSLQEWENVLKSQVWEMDEVRTNIFPFIALSYNELHPVLKRCFSYCAIFPKDYHINVDELIRIWMGQGCLNSSGVVGAMELKGREYFEDLATRSFFQDFEMDSVQVDRVEWCKMHDLVHDFAQFLTKNECLIAQNEAETQNGLQVVENIRHLNLSKFEAKITTDLFSHSQTRKLCSFMCTGNGIPLNLFSHLKRVKLLTLNGCELKDVPSEIGNLIHIRYLNLSDNSIEKLPESICDLYNLQTLNLTVCIFLSGLPQGIQKLKNLRHLLVEGTPSRFEFTQGLEKLVNLQTLDRFGCIRGYDNKLGYLKDLNQLGGSLTITIIFLDDEYDYVLEAEKADLKSKSFIQHLTLEFEEVVGWRLMDALQPHPNLLSLNFTASYLPNWITTLTNLRKLEIGEVENDNGALHYLRNLPFLEDLTLFDLQVESLSLEFFGLSSAAATSKQPSAFPKLVDFTLHYCKMLETWDDIEEDDAEDDTTFVSILPCLQRLEILLCWGLKLLPHRLLRKAATSLQMLHVGNCQHLRERYSAGGEHRDKFAHIPDVFIN